MASRALSNFGLLVALALLLLALPAAAEPVPIEAGPRVSDAPPGYKPIEGPERLKYRYDPKLGVPPGYELEARPRLGLVISGSLVFGVTYMLSTIAAASESGGPDTAATNWLYVPLLGPFIGATQVDMKRMCPNGDFDYYSRTYDPSPCNEGLANTFMLVGGVQLIGAAFVALGLTSPKRWVVPSPIAQVSVAPVRLGRSAVGLGASGRF